MKTKSFILTALAYVIPTIILGIVWHLVIFKDLYHSLGIYNRPDPIFSLGIANIVIQGMVMAFLYPFYIKNKTAGLRSAIGFNWLMGLFLFSVSTLANAAKIQVSSLPIWLLIQTAFHFIQFSTTGVLMGLVTKHEKAEKFV